MAKRDSEASVPARLQVLVRERVQIPRFPVGDLDRARGGVLGQSVAGARSTGR